MSTCPRILSKVHLFWISCRQAWQFAWCSLELGRSSWEKDVVCERTRCWKTFAPRDGLCSRDNCDHYSGVHAIASETNWDILRSVEYDWVVLPTYPCAFYNLLFLWANAINSLSTQYTSLGFGSEVRSSWAPRSNCLTSSISLQRHLAWH